MVTDVWTWPAVVTSLAVGPHGSLYALEMSTGNLQEPPFLMHGSGQVVRRAGLDSFEVVAEGLTFPVSLDVGPDGAMYVSPPALGTGGGEGTIINLDAAADILDATPAADATVACAPILETLSAPAGDASPVPEASPVA